MASSTIFSMFGQSPIKPLQNHMLTVVACVDHLQDFFDAACNQEWADVEKIYNQISALESEADAQKQEIRLHLPKSLFMPINRSDLIHLLSKQDKICNTAKDIAGVILGRQQVIHPSLTKDMKAYVKSAILVAHEALSVIEELHELIGSGFGSREIDRINKRINKLDTAEHKNDERQISIRSKLHSIEDQMQPVDVMFLYKTIESIGNLADRAQSAGEQIQIIIAR